jgi:lipopolysaccharide transport system permease protein
MKDFSASPVEMFVSLWRNRLLIGSLTKREVIGRYRGSFLGIFWSFFNPMFMLAIYSFVFGEVFNSRWAGGSDSKGEFALVLFAGLIMFNLFAECISRAPTLVLSNANYVKKVIFPLEIFPWITVGCALFHAAVSMLVWFIAYGLMFGMPHLTVLMFPIVFLPFIFLIVGLTCLLSSLGVFLRDIGQMIGILITAMMFLSPLFFPISALPESYRSFLQFNPITIPIQQLREVLFWGREPDWMLLGIYSGVSLVLAWLAFAFFQKSRKGFADVI